MSVTRDASDATQTDRKLSECVISALAEAKGVDPMDLDTPLYTVIDPDALDRLFQPTSSGQRSTGHVTFTIDNHEVTVYSDGRVNVTAPANASVNADAPAPADD